MGQSNASAQQSAGSVPSSAGVDKRPTRNQRRAAEAVKEEGNEMFKRNKLSPAIEKYTEAIALDPTWAVPLVNRAICFKRREEWQSVTTDCKKALSLDPSNTKALYYEGLSQRHLLHYDVAISNLQKALESAREAGDNLKEDIWRELARAKYEAWEVKRQEREMYLGKLRTRLQRMMQALHRQQDSSMQVDGAEDMAEQQKWDRDAVEWLLQQAEEPLRRKEPLPAFVCPLSLDVFREPVVSPSGLSFEKGSLLDHLQQVGEWDPVTRQPVKPAQVLPNLGLRAATQHYLEEHPWVWKDCI